MENDNDHSMLRRSRLERWIMILENVDDIQSNRVRCCSCSRVHSCALVDDLRIHMGSHYRYQGSESPNRTSGSDETRRSTRRRTCDESQPLEKL